MANKRNRWSYYQIYAKRKSVPNRSHPSAATRWPIWQRPWNGGPNGNIRHHNQMHNIRWTNGCGSGCAHHPPFQGPNRDGTRGCNTQIFQPKPMKFNNVNRDNFETRNYNQGGENLWLVRHQRFHEFDIWDEFTQELEDRIEADLEIESILESVPQIRSLSQGKLLPERPGNPIINDKFFKNEDIDNSKSLNGQQNSTIKLKQIQIKYRECSVERQKRILQEDFEAEIEMNQLLSPEFSNQNKDSSIDSISSSSDSSFESEFSNTFNEEISQEN